MQPRAYLGLDRGAAEVEVGHLLTELHTGRFTGTSFELVTVAESPDPITSMGGIRMVPDALLADLQPAPWPCRCWNAPGRSGRRGPACWTPPCRWPARRATRTNVPAAIATQ